MAAKQGCALLGTSRCVQPANLISAVPSVLGSFFPKNAIKQKVEMRHLFSIDEGITPSAECVVLAFIQVRFLFFRFLHYLAFHTKKKCRVHIYETASPRIL